jgi:cytochrome c oxidase subunit 2
MSTLVARSDMARDVLNLYALITWASIVIALIVFAILCYVLVRFRDRPGTALPPQTHGRPWLEIAWTIGPALVLLLIAVPTVQVIFRTQTQAKPAEALEVVVRGYQWWWEFAYPGLGVTTANELVVPAGRQVFFALEGPDVLHSFWVPKFGGKRDVVPGRHNALVLTPDAPGEFWGHCAEFCGASHANMMFKVIVEPQAEFDAWVAQQKAPSPPPDSTSLAARGLAIYQKSQCVACHMIDGVSYGVLGPNLTKLATRSTIASGMFPNDEAHLKPWIQNAPAKKPGSLMLKMDLSDADADAVVAYLRTRR